LELLIKELKRIETHAKDSTVDSEGNTLWFKFGDDDTLATDIKDIRNDLTQHTNHVNRLLILYKMKKCTELGVNDELRVFYS